MLNFMDRKSGLFYSAAFVFGTLMLLSTTSNGVSDTFEVYAADNCDASSTCTNTPGLSTQRNDCSRNSECINQADLQPNTQNNNCAGSRCENYNVIIAGTSNTQKIDCARASCVNGSFGSSNTQTIACANSFCGNDARGSTTQNLACQSTTICTNSGTNTNVISNSAFNCESNGPDTTTICQKDRTFVVPNH